MNKALSATHTLMKKANFNNIYPLHCVDTSIARFLSYVYRCP